MHLVFNLLWCVSEENGGVGITGTHLGLRALQGWEESGVQQSWFGIADPWSYITGHPEVRILDEQDDCKIPYLAYSIAVYYCDAALTWSMAQGMRHCMSFLLPKICGKELLKDGAAWMAGKLIFPGWMVNDKHMQKAK